MTPNVIIEAHKAMSELTSVPFPFKTARQVAALQRRLKEETDTICAMETAMVEKHGGKADTRGKASFPDAGKAAAYLEERNRFFEEDTDVELPTVDLSKYTEQLRISPKAINALDGIVIFGKEDADHGG